MKLFSPPQYSLATICLCISKFFLHKQIIEKLYWDIFSRKQIIAKLYQGYSLAMIFIAKLYQGYVLYVSYARTYPGIFVRGGICLPVTPEPRLYAVTTNLNRHQICCLQREFFCSFLETINTRHCAPQLIAVIVSLFLSSDRKSSRCWFDAIISSQ